MKTKSKYKDFQEYLYESLQDPQEALEYLNQALLDEDERVFLLALKDVIEARGGDMTELAEMAKLDRVNLYRMLSKKGNPRWSSMRSVLHAMGLNLTIQPVLKK